MQRYFLIDISINLLIFHDLPLLFVLILAEVLPQEIQKPDQRRGVQGAVPHVCHP